MMKLINIKGLKTKANLLPNKRFDKVGAKEMRKHQFD